MAIRTLQIIDRLNVGGPTKYVTWLAAGLDPEEFETLLVTGTIPPGEGDMAWFTREAGVTPVIIPEMSRELSPKDLLVLWKLLVLMFRYQPDIVHTHKAKAGAVGRAAALIYRLVTGKRCQIVHIYHGHIFHSYYGRLKTTFFLTIERWLARLATDRILTISAQQREEIGGTFRVGHPDQHQVIPYGLDFSTTSGPTLHEVLGITDRSIPLVGLVGRLCEVKNHEMFIEAAAILHERQIPVRFVILGDGHLREELEAQVRAKGLTETVLFTGFRDDVMNLYADLTLVAITSLNEGTPFTLIEGMNFGVPAVATAVGGVVDLMGDPITDDTSPVGQPDSSPLPGVELRPHGALVRSRDSESFATAVQLLLEDPARRTGMGDRARRYIHQNFSRERFISDIAELYRQMVVGRGR